MVSSLVHGLTKPNMGLLPPSNILFPLDPVDVVSSDHSEFDFSDVFGSVPIEAIFFDSGVSLFDLEKSELLFDHSLVIYTKKESLVGSACLSQSLKLDELTVNVGDPMELKECTDRGNIVEFHETSKDVVLVEDHKLDVDFNLSKPPSIGIGDFEVMKVVGRGAFGKVFQVRMKGSGEIYAMKVIRKDKIMEKNHAEYMKAERDILTKIDHPFIVQLRYSFQSKYRLYLVLDFINGGHLFFQLNHQGLFKEDLARIYAAEIVSAVSHLHQNGIMHRDLKPENILLDEDGHAMLTDFGLAKQFEENTRSNSMCGTVEYMSPEIICGKGHDKAADWWSVGILLFEMLTGKPPFIGGNNAKIQQKILKDKIKLPAYLTSEAHSLLKALLQKDANKRLGSGAKGGEEIKRHRWFKDIKWKKLENREMVPGFRPQVAGKQCVSNFEKRWTDMSLADSPASSPKFRSNPNIFNDFGYVRPNKKAP